MTKTEIEEASSSTEKISSVWVTEHIEKQLKIAIEIGDPAGEGKAYEKHGNTCLLVNG